MNKTLCHFKIFYFVLLLLVFSGIEVHAQSVGDYRSNVNTTGIWTSSGSWEYYDGSTWVPATYSPGTMGQVTGAVLIQAGDVITIGNSGILTETMGTLRIDGSLVLNGTNTGGVGTNFIFQTQTVVVTPYIWNN